MHAHGDHSFRDRRAVRVKYHLARAGGDVQDGVAQARQRLEKKFDPARSLRATSFEKLTEPQWTSRAQWCGAEL